MPGDEKAIASTLDDGLQKGIRHGVWQLRRTIFLAIRETMQSRKRTIRYAQVPEVTRSGLPL
jgi:hypothetical protein